MSAVVADTHALLWFLNNSPKLSASALAAFEKAEQSRRPVYVPAIVVAELRYLVEKGTITEADYQTVLTTLKSDRTAPTLAPLDLDVADALSRIPRATVADMPDRITAATALSLGLPLISRDTSISRLTVIQVV